MGYLRIGVRIDPVHSASEQVWPSKRGASPEAERAGDDGPLRYSEWLERLRERESDCVELSEACRKATQESAESDHSASMQEGPDRGWPRLGDAPEAPEVDMTVKVQRVYRDAAPNPVGGLVDVVL